MKKWILIASMIMSPASWAADVFVGGHGGLLGLGVEVGLDFGKTRVRAQLNQYDIDETDDYDGIDYDITLDLESFGVLVDYAPFDGAFYLTAGLYDNGTEISGDADVTNAEIGDVVLPGDNTVYTDVGFDGTAPYLGLGWRFMNNGKDKSGLGVSVDLGVYMNGDPDVEVTTSDETFNATFEDDIAKEEQAIEDDLDDVEMLPVAKIGLSWYF